jgi:hypothetical protein
MATVTAPSDCACVIAGVDASALDSLAMDLTLNLDLLLLELAGRRNRRCRWTPDGDGSVVLSGRMQSC